MRNDVGKTTTGLWLNRWRARSLDRQEAGLGQRYGVPLPASDWALKLW